VADQFEATIVWMDEEEMLPGRAYWLKLGTQMVSATVQQPKYQVNVNTMEHLAAKTLELNAIGVAELATDRPIPFESYADNRTLGGFILIDKMTNARWALACCISLCAARRMSIGRRATSRREPCGLEEPDAGKVLWFTGLSGAGKSTIANLVEKRLNRMNRHTFLLDGDNVRHGLNKDLGFTEADRIENIRRVGEVAKLMTDAGLIVITAFISPFRSRARYGARDDAGGRVYRGLIDTPLADAEARDVKGLYKKARSGTT
jgi:bifunctional enzyme CysN/CysC